ncbi:glycosyltransferase family 1 protein [Mycena floridula]|nr:glycosyltransferase family 1 protein [Mycena floridula]
MQQTLIATALVAVLVLLRIYFILPRKTSRSYSTKTRKLAVFLGSGGHTTEALTLISALDFQRYTPRTYLVSEGDTFSAPKALALEAAKHGTPSEYTILVIPRARRVHQSLLTTPWTTLASMLTCIYYTTYMPLFSAASAPFADVLILNGPGTCLPLCMAVYLAKFLGVASPKIIYIESFARVKTLSLSGKLLRPIVDRFIVQWPALQAFGLGEFRGWLV